MSAGAKPFIGVDMGCSSCGRGFHAECKRCKGPKKCKCIKKETLELVATGDRKSSRVNLKDKSSTGRKRAAELYPIEEGASCEWRLKQNCGGGRVPIIGCFDGVQEHRHHGPVKDTLNNYTGNVHRICNDCHVHWHELNDLVYDEREFRLLPHDPVEATMDECVKNALEWRSGNMKKKYTLASSKNREKHAAQSALQSQND